MYYHLAVKTHPTCNELLSELFESIGDEHPYRVRAIDKKTGEIGPQIVKFKSLSSAAKFYENHGVTW